MDAAHGESRRRHCELRSAHLARRRRVPFVELPLHRERGLFRGPVRIASERVRSRHRGPHEQSAVRRECAASGWCSRVSRTKRRWTCSPTRAGSTRSRSGCGNELAPGDEFLTGQRIEGVLPVAEIIRSCAAMPLPDPAADDVPRASRRLGTDGRRGRRSARCRVRGRFQEPHVRRGATWTGRSPAVRIDGGIVTITCAAAEVGQGFVTLVQQIGRTVLGVDDVIVAPRRYEHRFGRLTSASRQTMMSGGAVEKACRAARAELVTARSSCRTRSSAGSISMARTRASTSPDSRPTGPST